MTTIEKHKGKVECIQLGSGEILARLDGVLYWMAGPYCEAYHEMRLVPLVDQRTTGVKVIERAIEENGIEIPALGRQRYLCNMLYRAKPEAASLKAYAGVIDFFRSILKESDIVKKKKAADQKSLEDFLRSEAPNIAKLEKFIAENERLLFGIEKLSELGHVTGKELAIVSELIASDRGWLNKLNLRNIEAGKEAKDQEKMFESGVLEVELEDTPFKDVPPQEREKVIRLWLTKNHIDPERVIIGLPTLDSRHQIIHFISTRYEVGVIFQLIKRLKLNPADLLGPVYREETPMLLLESRSAKEERNKANKRKKK